jgi:hypothetical protein
MEHVKALLGWCFARRVGKLGYGKTRSDRQLLAERSQTGNPILHRGLVGIA